MLLCGGIAHIECTVARLVKQIACQSERVDAQIGYIALQQGVLYVDARIEEALIDIVEAWDIKEAILRLQIVIGVDDGCHLFICGHLYQRGPQVVQLLQLEVLHLCARCLVLQLLYLVFNPKVALSWRFGKRVIQSDSFSAMLHHDGIAAIVGLYLAVGHVSVVLQTDRQSGLRNVCTLIHPIHTRSTFHCRARGVVGYQKLQVTVVQRVKHLLHQCHQLVVGHRTLLVQRLKLR